MKPKGIPKRRGSPFKPSMGYSGIAIDLLSSISITQTQISETVEVTKPTEPLESITETVAVVIT